jgi:hypothetical protein
MKKAGLIFALAVLGATIPARAQQASFVYRLGKDTSAVEQFTRTATSFVGEVVRRSPTVLRIQYDVALGPDGHPTRATVRQRQADGTPVPNAATELRLTFTADSVRRELVWPDSTQTRMIAARNAIFLLTWPSQATMELLAAALKRTPGDSVLAIGQGPQPSRFRLAPSGGDTVRVTGGPGYEMRMRFDGRGNMLLVDGTYTTNKVLATRGGGGLDIGAIASRLTPVVPSARGNATFTFGASPIFIDYGRPQVRDRTVWGGVLVPFDSVWRAGANAATHLATTKPLAFGDVNVPAGLYTLWIQHTRTGTFLIVNKGIGQWGTGYDSTQNVGRVPMPLTATLQFVEEFTIAIRALPQSRGAIDFAFGSSVATATFTIRQ